MADVDDAPAAPQVTDIQRSSRDLEQLRVDLERWLATKLPDGAHPLVPELTATSANGMSSETLLFQATWAEDGTPRSERLVARVAPDPGDVPVFPTYDLDKQFRAIQEVGERTDVPVPRVWWSEPDETVIGAPFFVMSRVDGDVPPDVLPYNFGDSWLFHATPAQQRHLQDATVDVIAALHDVPAPEETFGFLAFAEAGSTALRRHVAHTRAWYDFAAADGTPSPLVERGFDWLEAHWPRTEGETVLCWGDSRIGNVLYREFRPVAVLDWEMAGLGPRELDVAWLLYAHRMFEDMASAYGFPGMPDFLRVDDVVDRYEALTGRRLHDVEWYLTYSAVQLGIVFLRTSLRQVHFGERPMPDDIDELIITREPFQRILDGDYVWH